MCRRYVRSRRCERARGCPLRRASPCGGRQQIRSVALTRSSTARRCGTNSASVKCSDFALRNAPWSEPRCVSRHQRRSDCELGVGEVARVATRTTPSSRPGAGQRLGVPARRDHPGTIVALVRDRCAALIRGPSLAGCGPADRRDRVGVLPDGEAACAVVSGRDGCLNGCGYQVPVQGW